MQTVTMEDVRVGDTFLIPPNNKPLRVESRYPDGPVITLNFEDRTGLTWDARQPVQIVRPYHTSRMQDALRRL